MNNDDRNTLPAAARESSRKKRGGPRRRLQIHRRGADRDRKSPPAEFYRISVKFEDDALVSLSSSGTEGAFILSSPEAVKFSDAKGTTAHIYEIVVSFETARAIVEAYCEKLAASPEIAAQEKEQLRPLAPALARLLSAILEGAGPEPTPNSSAGGRSP